MSLQGPSPLPFRPPSIPAATAPRAAGRAVPSPAAEPAAGGESSLWALLTDEEREFFSQQATLGPLTYGRAAAGPASPAAPAAPLGQRLDVKG